MAARDIPITLGIEGADVIWKGKKEDCGRRVDYRRAGSIYESALDVSERFAA